jgi:hypothetical protein
VRKIYEKWGFDTTGFSGANHYSLWGFLLENQTGCGGSNFWAATVPVAARRLQTNAPRTISTPGWRAARCGPGVPRSFGCGCAALCPSWLI